MTRPISRNDSLPAGCVEHKLPQASSEIALIEILSQYHNKIDLITRHQMAGLKETNYELERASKEFLDSLKDLFETERQSSSTTGIIKSLEYATWFASIALGIGICTIAPIISSVMIATGTLGCVHTTFELTGAYNHIANFTDNRDHQDIIKKYLPAMIATSLALSVTVTGAYSSTMLLSPTLKTVQLFLPMVVQSLQTAQVVSKGVFDLHKNNAEIKKIDHEALGKCLETILDEQQSAMTGTMTHQSKINKDALHTLKTLISLHKHF